MHERLHATLHAFAADAAATLAAAVAAGDEVPFEVVEAGAHGARPGLFHYRLLANYIELHWETIMRLPAAAAAQAALEGLGDLSGYLDTYAAQRSASAPASMETLRCLIHRVLDACEGEFVSTPDRFEPAYREIADATDAQESDVVVLALLRGIACESPEVELAEGTMLVPLERLEVPPNPIGATHRAPRRACAAAAAPGVRSRPGHRPPARCADRDAPVRPGDLARAARVDPRAAGRLAGAAGPGGGRARRAGR